MKIEHFVIGVGAVLGLGAFALTPRRIPVKCRSVPPGVLMLTAPFIDTDVAGAFLYALDQHRDPDTTIVVHTRGGLVVSCAQIAEALLNSDNTVIVPYMAFSGGTLIALSASKLKMGDYAALTPVDPIIDEQRAIHSKDFDDPVMRKYAEEYTSAISGLVDRILDARLAVVSKKERARDFLLGRKSPHGWPAGRKEIAELGFAVEAAGPGWGQILCFQGGA